VTVPSSETQTGLVPAPVHHPLGDAAVIRSSMDQPERFAEIYDAYFVAIHGYVARRLGQDVADDLAAETFLIAFRQRARYDPVRESARPWLYGIATNLVGRPSTVRGPSRTLTPMRTGSLPGSAPCSYKRTSAALSANSRRASETRCC
jgi:hypothetical protein